MAALSSPRGRFIQRMYLLAIFMFLTLVSASSADNSDHTCDAGSSPGECIAPSPVQTPNKTYPECGLYMAQSTIPNAGLGIFTSIPIKPMDIIGKGDVCLPQVNGKLYTSGSTLNNPFEAYQWTGQSMGMSRESSTKDVEAICPGLDCVVNCNPALINTYKSSPLYDYAGLHRAQDPGAGSFTPYHNGTTYASKDIPAGGEIFKYYGDGWFTSRPEMFDDSFPLYHDYPDAQFLLGNWTAMKLPEHIQQELYEDFVVVWKNSSASRVMGAMPGNAEDALAAAKDGIAALHQPAATRSLEWLNENGRCIDNIQPGYSSLRQAGRGAFATRSLSADQIIATSPLHHLARTTFLEMYELQESRDPASGGLIPVVAGVKGFQILVNYCFTHPESTMFVCPYGSGVNYINHNQTLANVRIQWAEDFVAHNQTLVEQGSLEDFVFDTKPVLSFDYVALRDIAPGEELFLDYGDSFEEAWKSHVRNWKPVQDAENYMESMGINVRYYKVPIRTAAEELTGPYPDYLQIRVHASLADLEFLVPGNFTWAIVDYGLPARILERFLTENEHYYTIELGVPSTEAHKVQDTLNTETDLNWIRKEKVPRSAIAFFDKPGQTDIHLRNAFRRFIGIPSEIFPEKWKNINEASPA